MSMKVPSTWGLEMADWFRGLCPETLVLAQGWREKWGRCFDDLLRLDKRQAEEIAKVCQWARAHDFWQSNFLSPLKLRQRDRNGVLYYDRFLAAMSPATARRALASAKEYVTERRKDVVE